MCLKFESIKFTKKPCSTQKELSSPTHATRKLHTGLATAWWPPTTSPPWSSTTSTTGPSPVAPQESGYSTQAMDTHQELGKEGCLPILPISTPTLTYIADTRRVMNMCFLFAGGSTAPTIAQDFPGSSSTQYLASGSPGLPTTCTLTRSTSTTANRCSEESVTQGIKHDVSSLVHHHRSMVF